jgi:hypothetical protein
VTTQGKKFKLLLSSVAVLPLLAISQTPFSSFSEAGVQEAAAAEGGQAVARQKQQ